MMNKSYRVVLSRLVWALPALLIWFVAVGEVLHYRGDPAHPAAFPDFPSQWAISIVNSSGYGMLLITYLAPFVALFCGRKALMKAVAAPRFARIAFWTMTFVGVAAFVLILQGLYDRLIANGLDLRRTADMNFVMSDFVVPAVLIFAPLFLITIVQVLWSFLRRRSGGNAGGVTGLATFKDALAGAGCFVVFAVLAFAATRVVIDARANRIAKEADRRWAEIGRPMPEFAKGLSPVKENAALESLVKVLEPWGVKTLYASGDELAAGYGGMKMPKEVSDFLSRELTEGDLVDSLDRDLPYLASHEKQFERVYQSILAQDPPAWRFEPLANESCPHPSFAALRGLAQLFSVDARRRSSNGDHQGAACATYAALRVSEYLGKYPVLASQMFRSAMETMMYHCNIARLPGESSNWQGIGDRAQSERANFIKAIQYDEALVPLQGVAVPALPRLCGDDPVPRWLEKLLGPSLYHLHAAKGSLAAANAVAVINEINPLTSSDMGEAKLTAVHDADGNSWNYTRAWLRLNFCLLMEEQAEVIRYARGRMQDGTIADHTECPSSVIPGAVWRVIPDVAGNSIALKLSPLPEWTKSSTVYGPQLFLLPLDGSKSWKFAGQSHPGERSSAGSD